MPFSSCETILTQSYEPMRSQMGDRFWEDNWLEVGPLSSHPNLNAIKDSALAFFGLWVIDYISLHKAQLDISQCCQSQCHLLHLATELQQFLQHVRIPIFNEEDLFVWSKNSKGNFSVKSAYLLLLKEGTLYELWRKTWIPHSTLR